VSDSDLTIAVIENADAFSQRDRVLPNVDLAVFASGRMSGRLLIWLASPALATCPIIHWGDYDPVGVAEYLRLQEYCGDRVTTYVPQNLEPLLKRHGKRKLITEHVEILSRLRVRLTEPHVAGMIALFDEYRKGLEQELLRNTPYAEYSRAFESCRYIRVKCDTPARSFAQVAADTKSYNSGQ
jgi:hypothetical protein